MPALLVTTIFAPVFGVLLLGLLPGHAWKMARTIALLVTLLSLGFAIAIVSGFMSALPHDGAFAVTEYQWLSPESGIDVRFHVGLDGISLWLFALSALLMVTAVLVSWDAITERAALFYAMLLLLECGCLGVFAARDIILFYIFFEFTLIPLFFLIGIWGSEERRYAAAKFFLYTLAGSLLTFLGLLSIVLWDFFQTSPSRGMSFSIPYLTESLMTNPMPVSVQLWVFLALFAGFAIKVPLFPLHTWLPLAHVQAPTAGSVILAGVMLKFGTYGFVRFSIPMLPEASALCMPWLLWLSVAGIIYGALVALAQTDIKRLIAYSSVSHLGFCMLGLFALNQLGAEGAVLQMVNHGISTGALFAIVGMIYERYHTRQIDELGGLARRMPVLTFFMLLFTFSSIGLPGLNGFAGEFLLLIGVFQRGWADAPAPVAWQLQVISVLAVLGVVLGAWYMLWLIQRVFFGSLREPAPSEDAALVRDLSWREIMALAPLAIFVFWIGLWPQFYLKPMSPALRPVVESAGERVQQQLGETERTASRVPPLNDVAKPRPNLAGSFNHRSRLTPSRRRRLDSRLAGAFGWASNEQNENEDHE